MKARVRANWSAAIIVCAKCSKRLGGGFGLKGKTSLAKALRRRLGLKKGRTGRAGIVEARCLGVCPHGAVTVIDAANPGEWILVPGGADIDALAAELGLAD